MSRNTFFEAARKILKEKGMPLKVEEIKLLSDYVSQTFTAEEKASLKSPKYFYEVEFNKPGGMIMPILVEITYEDGTKENNERRTIIMEKGKASWHFLKKINLVIISLTSNYRVKKNCNIFFDIR